MDLHPDSNTLIVSELIVATRIHLWGGLLFNELQTILIRERLIYWYRAKFQRKSVRLILEEIVFSDATEYDVVEFSVHQKEYDAGFPLTNDTLYNFLIRKTDRLANQYHLEQIAAYLISVGILTAAELNRVDEQAKFKFPLPEMIPKNTGRGAIQKVASGEYADFVASEKRRHFSNLICAQPNRKQYISTNRQSALFEKNKNEFEQSFIQRFERGDYNEISINFGQMVSVDDDLFWLIESPSSGSFIPICYEVVLPKKTDTAMQVRNEHKTYQFSPFDQLDEKLQKVLFAIKRKAYRHMFAPKFDISYNNLNNILILDMDNNNKLIDAAKYNDVVLMVEAIIGGADINFQCPKTGWTAGHWVANNGSHEGFAVLFFQDHELPMLRHAVFNSVSTENVEERWKDAISKRNPLMRDNEGYMASARISTYRPFRTDAKSKSDLNLGNLMMGVEGKAAEEEGLNYWDIVWAECEVAFPKLER